MNLEELKLIIESKQSNKLNFLIFICNDENSNFIFHQYVNAYATNQNLSIELIDTYEESSQFNLFDIKTTSLKVLYVDSLDDIHVPKNDCVWVRCKSKGKTVNEDLIPYIIDVPKLEDWHIKDYVYSLLSDIPTQELNYFLTTHKNIYNISNELDKLSCFQDKNKAYEQIKDQLYIDTSEYAIFDLVNALLRCDKSIISKLLLSLDNIDIDVFGLIKLLLVNFKRVIDIQLALNPTAESVNVTSKQFWAIKKYSCNIYTRNQLVEIYKLLTKCDYYIKSGYISTDVMLNYILINILTIKERII